MSWNPNEQEETKSFELIPKGAYKVLIAEAETKSQDSNRSGIKVTLQILDPSPSTSCEYTGRKVFLWFTWDHTNPEAVRIGRSKLADLLFACGAANKPYESSDEVADAIKDCEVYANIGVGKRSDNNELRNDALGFFDLNGMKRGQKMKATLDKFGGVVEGKKPQAKPQAATSEKRVSGASFDDGVPF